jgi:hypothetical protein
MFQILKKKFGGKKINCFFTNFQKKSKVVCEQTEQEMDIQNQDKMVAEEDVEEP